LLIRPNIFLPVNRISPFNGGALALWNAARQISPNDQIF
jgi:hypothetical protein